MQSSRKNEALIAFGANRGDCQTAFEAAVQALRSAEAVLELKVSQAVRTKAVTGDSSATGSQDEYLNAAIRILTTWTVEQLHQEMIAIERQLGREREQRWGPRTIDLDLLLYGDLQLQSDDLTVPHPRMSFRRFVLEPALQVAEDMVHPVSGMNLRQLIDHLENSDPRIVVATNQRSFAENMAQNVAGDIRIVESHEEFIAEAANARLVVSCIDESAEDEQTGTLIRFAYNFAGPTLRIDPIIGDTMAARELRAAMEAMQ